MDIKPRQAGRSAESRNVKARSERKAIRSISILPVIGVRIINSKVRGMEHNIFNLIQMDAWLDEHRSSAGGRADIGLWVRQNFRNYLLRDYEQLQVLEIVPFEVPLFGAILNSSGR